MFQNTTDEPQGLVRQVGVFVACKKWLAVFPDRHVHVHAGAVVARDGFGHEGGGFTVGVCHVVDHVLVLLQVVGLFGQRTEDQAEFVLAGRNLVMVLVDLHAHAFHCGQHLGT